jgi:3-oxoacyl-[acyl-carrier protein] reductase
VRRGWTPSPDLHQVRARVERELGTADILLAFAGGSAGWSPAWELDDEQWRATLDANLTATFLTVREFLPGMVARRRGSIVTVSSAAARQLDALAVASYAAAKAGVGMFTRHVAKEVGPYGVRANVVAPATTSSPAVAARLDPERRREITELTPLRRLGDPADTALAAAFLASDASSWITGTTLDVSGGRVMR